MMTDDQREAQIAWHSERLQAHFLDGRKALARWHQRVFTGLINGRSKAQIARMEAKSTLCDRTIKNEGSYGAR